MASKTRVRGTDCRSTCPPHIVGGGAFGRMSRFLGVWHVTAVTEAWASISALKAAGRLTTPYERGNTLVQNAISIWRILAMAIVLASTSLFAAQASAQNPSGQIVSTRAAAGSVATAPGQSATLLPNGQWLLVGGVKDVQPQSSIWVASGASVQSFPAALQFERSGHSATVLPNGNVLVFGGRGADGQLVTTPELIDPMGGTVQTISIPGLVPRTEQTATLLTSGKVLFVGGLDSTGRAIADAQLWDPRTNSVDAYSPALLWPRYDQSASLQPNGVDLISGGWTAASTVPPPEQYSPLTGVFEQAPPSGLAGARSSQAQAPGIAEGLPLEDPAGVPVDSPIAVRFTSPVAISQLNSSTVTLVGPNGAVSGQVVGAEGGMLAFFTPSIALLPDTTYTLFVNGVADATGNAVPLSSVRFTTRRYDSGNSNTSTNAASPPALQPAGTALATSGSIKPGAKAVPTQPAKKNAAKLISKPEPPAPDSPDEGDWTEDWTPQEPNRHGQWRVLGLAGDPAFDTRGARAQDLIAPSGTTAVAGHVVRLNGKPIGGVLVSTGEQSTVTDAEGRFLLIGVAPGIVLLKIDGRGVLSHGRHYTEHFLQETVAVGMTTVIPAPIYLPRVDPATEVSISSPADHEIVLTHPAIPGLEVHIPQGAVIRERDGSIVTRVSITPVPLDRPPYPTPVPFSTYFTLQPGGAYVDGDPSKAIKVIYPNFEGLSPGTRVNFWNYDPAASGWTLYGHGTVTPDGKQVTPDESLGFRQIMSFGLGIQQGNGQPTKGPVPNGACAGDPVDCATGLFTLTETDLVVRDVIPISVTRTYRTNDNVSRSCGVGCNLSYSMWLSTGSGANEIDLIRGDGSQIQYFPVSGSSPPYHNTNSPTEFMGSVLALNTTTDLWNLTLRNGTVLRFRNAVWPNQLVSITDRNGNTVTITSCTANNNGCSSTSSQPNAAPITQMTSPNGRYIQLSYDSSNRLKSTLDNAGRTTSYQYDSQGRLQQVTDADGNTESYGYDPVTNNMNLVTDKRNNAKTQNKYDGNGRVSQQMLADGALWKFSYLLDAKGNVTQTTITDPRNHITLETFNASGYLTQEVLAQGLPEQQTYVFTLNSNNLLGSVLDPLGRKTAYVYDSFGDVKSVTLLSGTANAATYSLQYDPTYHQLTQITDPLGHSTSYGLDTSGNIRTITDALGNVTVIHNDSQGLPTQVVDPLNNTIGVAYRGADIATVTDGLSRTSSAFTDALGRVTQFSDALGNRRTLTYDPMDRVQSVLDPAQNTTGLSYDPNGNLTTVTDPRGARYQWGYDVRNRVHTSTDPNGNVVTLNYDGMGNLTSKLDAKQQLTQYSYDGLNRLTTITYADNSTVQITWDAGNRPYKFTDSLNGQITRTFNNLDQLTDEVAPQGEVQYVPDVIGRRAQMTVVGQSQPIQYGYDNANRLTSIAQGTVSVGLQYDSANRLQTLTLPNGIVQTYGFDAANELSSISYDRGATHVGDLAYTYDGAGRRNGQSGSLATLVLPSNPAGSLSAWASASYTWNARNQLVATSWGNSTFTYDALGRRTTKTIGGVTTSYQYDGLNPVMVNGSLMLEGLGLDQYFARITAGTVTSFLTDGLGSTIALTNSSGATTASYAYGPYGNVSASGSDSTPFQFTGRENDGAANLYHYRARYYNPTFGQFISADPIGLAGGINPYAYAGGNPISFTDPLGLCQHRPSVFRILADNPALLAMVVATEIIGGGPEDPIADAAVAAEIAEAEEAAAAAAEAAEAAETAEAEAAAAPVAPDFVVTPNGEVIPVPEGATGPVPTNSPGFQYNGGSGGNGLAPNVTDVRIMEPNAQNPSGYVNYGSIQSNGGWQSVNPYTGQSVPPANPWWHIPINTQ